MYSHVPSRLLRDASFAHLSLLAAGFALALTPLAARANPPGWSTGIPITITEGSGTDLTGYQVRLVIDTASIIAAGNMDPNGNDVRFATDFEGTGTVPYWIESGINTASTVVWIKVPLLPASTNTGVWLFSGNAAATSESTLDVFGFTSDHDNSATYQVSGASTGGVTESQRGFRFSPNEDVLLTHFGKNEPNGSARYITLFDFNSQAILTQMQVSGPPAQYSYAALAQPIWLTQNTQYLLEMYQGSSDGYYFGAAPQMNPLMTYYDMRYCNACTETTFPTNFLNGIHYGYSDFLFRTRQHASVEPVATPGAGPTQTSLQSDSSTPELGTTVTFTAAVDGIFSPGGSIDFTSDGSPIAGCTGVALNTDVPPIAACATSVLSAGDHSIVAAYAGDANNAGSTSGPLVQTILRLTSATTLGTACRTTFVEGQPITFQSSTTSSQSPAGTVTFDKSGAPMCTDVPLVAGMATCSVSDLAVVGGGPLSVYDVSAIYPGDADNLPSTSAILPVTVLSVTEALLRDGFDLGGAGCPTH
jgi:hypothetical protein